ncbi:MAG: hypothetical protein JSU73_12225 [candidate division WOR-3 bacterium]|nr:MAG: hypothetical protein JSU73_12225 [candidate division WOR-3 bacterium]
MKTLVRMALVVFLCGIAIAYLYVHHYSMGLTEEVEQAREGLRLRTQKLEQLRSEVEYLAGFARLDSVWASAGRPGCDPVLGETREAQQVVAERAVAGVGADAVIEPLSGLVDSLELAAATGDNRATQ